jgi:inner membrane transporter RhtA
VAQGEAALPARGARRSVPAPLLVLASIASVQFGAAVAKGMFDRLGPGGTVTLRVVAGAVFTLVLARPRLAGLSRRAIGMVVLFGLILAAMNWSFYNSLDRIPLGVAVTIEFIGPLGVAVAGSRRWVDGIWGLLAAGGVLLLTGGLGGGLDPLGILFAAFAGVCWAAYILVSQGVGRLVPGGAGLSGAMIVASVALLPVGIVEAGTDLLQPGLLLAGAAVGLLSSALPYGLEFVALRRLPANVFGVLMSLEPAVAALAGFTLLGETLVPRELAGIACVIVASAGSTRSARPRPEADPGA